MTFDTSQELLWTGNDYVRTGGAAILFSAGEKTREETL